MRKFFDGWGVIVIYRQITWFDEKKCVVKCVVDWREDRPDTRNDEELPVWLRMCDHVGNFCVLRGCFWEIGVIVNTGDSEIENSLI